MTFSSNILGGEMFATPVTKATIPDINYQWT